MDKMTAIPLKEVSGVKFGMKRADVRAILGKAKEFKKSKFSKNTTDDFGFCHVFYNADDECEAVEIFDGVQVTVDGTVVFPSDINAARKVLGEFREDDGGFTNISKSIGIYAPYGKMESILFGETGYYS